MSFADVLKQLNPKLTAEQIAAAEVALESDAQAIRDLQKLAAKVDGYDPAHVPVMEDPVIKAIRQAIVALQAVCAGAAAVVPGTPVGSVAGAIGAEAQIIQKVLEALVTEVEKVLFNAGLRP
jgi:hypothetical protein